MVPKSSFRYTKSFEFKILNRLLLVSVLLLESLIFVDTEKLITANKHFPFFSSITHMYYTRLISMVP